MANHGNRFGDHATITNSPVTTGDNTTVRYGPAPEPSPRPQRPAEARWDIGVVTILTEEAQAVRDVLKLRETRVGGLYFDTGEVPGADRPARVVATQALVQGQRSTMGALENLRKHYDPALLALVGVAGGIGDDGYAGIGDVVVATRIVYYDKRRETPEGPRRHGEEREAPAGIVAGVNAFFTRYGEPAEFHIHDDGFPERRFRAVPGPIGSGEAVVADAEHEIRRYLSHYNEKILAVEMEAGGLSQYWQENSVNTEHNPGWVVVRGISDHADRDRGHAHHRTAAQNAAHVLRHLLPYLM